jgi:hypothetical protein
MPEVDVVEFVENEELVERKDGEGESEGVRDPSPSGVLLPED